MVIYLKAYLYSFLEEKNTALGNIRNSAANRKA